MMEAVLEKPKLKKKGKLHSKHKNVEEINKPNNESLEGGSGEIKDKNKEEELTETTNEIYNCEKTEIEKQINIFTTEKNAEESKTRDTEIQDEVNELNVKDEKQVFNSEDQSSEKDKIRDKFNILLKENQDILTDIKLQEIVTPCIQPIINQPSIKEHLKIKPYTESQLSALYTNSELETLETFTNQFVEAELKGLVVKQHPLYELLSNYLHAREKLVGNNLELDQIRKEYKKLKGELWTTVSTTARVRGFCNDSVPVTATYTYNKCIFHKSVAQSLVRTLANLQKLAYENHVLYSFSAEELKIQIELYLQTVIANILTVTQLKENAPVALIMQDEPLHIKPYLNEIRLCISVLFTFQRKLIRDPQFLKETREWLSRLVGILLRLATYQDHLFLLNHVLRCPAGVGSWASSFIQIPLELNQDSPFTSYGVNHLLTICAAILLPIKERDKFLQDISQSQDLAQDVLWVMVDSDGEEDDEPSGTSLKENDLVAFINQLPLDNLFRTMLLIERRNFEDTYNELSRSEHHILKYFAFSTVLLRIIHSGIETYNHQKYSQFAKRLSRFIRHVTQYATDQWEQFKNSQVIEDKAMLTRLQVEYDAFFLRAIFYLYSSQKLGAWQFLAVIPYHLTSIECLWKIFYFLHTSDSAAIDILNPMDLHDYSKKIFDNELRSQFEDKLNGLEDAETYYLLNTFANMALARSETDMDFIFAATKDLIYIGFISPSLQESCSKSTRILLTHITSKYPHLMSNILKMIKSNLDTVKEYALYLYEELPLKVWRLSDDDLDIISKLIMNHPIGSVESKLGRMILSRLNWVEVPYEKHCQTAVLAVCAVDQDPGYLNWAWQMILRLRLHINDNEFTEIGRMQEVERYNILTKGIREQQPLSSFVTILMTTWGHLVPLICAKGLDQLLFLQHHQKHEAVLFALYLIVPLFVECQECIVNNEKFGEILVNLINADRGYISMAKSLISSQNTVLEQFGNMIETQIVNFKQYKYESPRCLVRLWINSLVSISNWNKDNGILYLLDVIIKAAFPYNEAVDAAYSILRDLSQCSTPQEQSGTISNLFKWVINNNANGALISNSLSPYPWLAYLMINIEHEEKEVHTGVWKEVLVQLSRQKGKINVDQAIKKATSIAKVPNFTSANLCIYRWAQQAMDTVLDHPILPLLWQKFFTLFLARITGLSPNEQTCVGEKFFDGLVNFAFLKRMKRRLQETVEFFEKKLEDEDLNENEKDFNHSLLKLYRAFLLWLEEPRLQENYLHLPSLPPQYEPTLIGLILQSSDTPWSNYLNYEKLKIDQENAIKTWRVSNFRQPVNVNNPLPQPGKSVESDDPVERILRRLNSYDAPKAPPKIVKSAPVIAPINFGNKDEMFKSLNECFSKLKQFAHNHCMKISEHKALDCAYLELMPQQYRAVPTKVERVIPCKSGNQTVNCSGAAHIIIEVQEARLNDRVDHQIQTNRSSFESILSKVLEAPALSLCTSAVTIQQAIRILQSQLACNPATAELGVELFYYILSLINEETTTYMPTKTLFATCLERLGQSHICGFENEMPRLLQTILKEPNLGGYLASHFTPSNVGSTNMLFMYSTICKEIGQKYDITFALLSKFEVENWLINKQPKISQRSQFIESVIKALTTLGFKVPVEALMLHGLYRRHLLILLEHQFPEHYLEILLTLLKNSNGSPDTSMLAISVWLDVLNFLAQPSTVQPKVPLREQLRQYGENQKLLTYQKLLETAEMLARHFTNERMQYGLYGLYPKCRNYLDIFVLLLGMVGHGLIVGGRSAHQDWHSDKISERIWPFIRDMFAPWLIPYSLQNMKDSMASWIQQLTDDRSILLPWISADGEFALKMVNCLTECMLFMLSYLPGSGNILSFVWQWYASCFTHTAVKDYILLPIHEELAKLPWHNFWPSITDLELMLRVIEQYLPESHSFLGHIFLSIPWRNWFIKCAEAPQEIQIRIHQCFLNLVVKLLNEPNVRNRNAEKAKSLLVQIETFNWSLIDALIYQRVMDWYVMSCDSGVIFKSDPLDLDYRVLILLKTISGYTKPTDSETTGDVYTKRIIYVKSLIKLLSVYTSRYKNNIVAKELELQSVIKRQLHDFDNYVQSPEEMAVILIEILGILNISTIKLISIKVFSEWIMRKSGDDSCLKALLKTLGMSVSDSEIVAELLEIVILCYFENTRFSTEPSWQEVIDLVNIYENKQKELELNLINKESILSLYVILLQRSHRSNNIENLLNLSLEWLSTIKIGESTESKHPLIWSFILTLSIQLCDENEQLAGSILYQFSQLLHQLSDTKNTTGWGRGLLNAIGITKQNAISLNFRFLCRALAGYILAQLPDMKGKPQMVRRVPNAPSRVGQAGGNSECVKLLMTLDFGQSQGKIKECAELALKQIQDSNNSLHNVKSFLQLLVQQFYIKPYLKNLDR